MVVLWVFQLVSVTCWGMIVCTCAQMVDEINIKLVFWNSITIVTDSEIKLVFLSKLERMTRLIVDPEVTYWCFIVCRHFYLWIYGHLIFADKHSDWFLFFTIQMNDKINVCWIRLLQMPSFSLLSTVMLCYPCVTVLWREIFVAVCGKVNFHEK